MRIIQPRSREEWFINDVGLVRKNICNWDGDKPIPGVKVALYGYYDRKYDQIAEVAEANWAAYCRRHGYALRTYPGAYRNSREGIVDGDREKFALYYDIRGLFDVVCYLDIDSLFINMGLTIERCVDPVYWPDVLEKIGPLKPFAWTYDDNGPNSSLLIARTDDRTEQHLRFAYERAKVENNVRHGRIEPGGISDQDSMRDLMNVPPFRDTFGHCYAASEIGIAFKEADVTPQAWIVTMAGLPFEEKLERMRALTAWPVS
jgi:hypothetical protein